MKYLKGRNEFLSENKISLPKAVNENEIYLPINEDRGPMGNDIPWGDSLVGRLFNSISRKLVIGLNKGRIALINKQINDAFESLLVDSKIQSSDVNRKDIEKIKVSFFLEELTNAVHDGLKVKYLIELTEKTIELAEKNDELKEKDLLLKQLNEFLDFLNELDPEEGEDLDEDITGMSKEDLAKGSDVESQGEGWGSDGEAIKGMVSMIKSLKGVIDKKEQSLTSEESDKEEVSKLKDLSYIKNKIEKEIKEKYSSKNKWLDSPLIGMFLTINNNVLYFNNQVIAKINEGGEFIGTIPKWDDQKKSFTGEAKPRILKVTNKITSNFSSYIVSSLKGKIEKELEIKLTDSQVEWFDKNIKGLWVRMVSKSGNHYVSQIGEINKKSEIELSPKPVKTQSSLILSSLMKRGVLYKDENKARLKVDDESPSYDKSIIIYDGNEYEFVDYVENDKISIKGKDDNVITVDRKSVKKKVNESFIFEKSKLSEKETDANQALNKLKNQLKNLISDDKGISISSEFLNNLSDFSKIKEKGNRNLLKKLFDKVKQQYEKLPDFNPLYEGFDVISDSSKIETVADKIARFAKRSMQFVGEGLYGSLGDLGKHLQKFNEEFDKLLNTDLKIEESNYFSDKDLFKMIGKNKVSSYSQFMMLNESVTQRIITYYDQKVNYNKWEIENKEIVSQIDSQIENVEIKEMSIDPIIEIVKLINRAYKIHTPGSIPSGRSGGKVSNRTFREYEFVGTGSSGTHDSPGSGPYRNKSLFNEFESNLLDIIKDEKYKPLFKEDVKIVESNSNSVTKIGDDSTETKTETEEKTIKKAGNGKILMKFITDILDGQDLYREGAQRRFFAEYFGFEIDGKTLGLKEEVDNKKTTTDDETEKDSKKKKVKFSTTSKGIRAEVGRVYIMENELDRNDKRFMVVTNVKDYDVYLKLSKNPKYMKNYLSGYKIEYEDILKSKDNDSESTFLKIDKNKFPLSKGDEYDVSGINLKEFKERGTSGYGSRDNKLSIFDKIYILTDSDGKAYELKVDNLSYDEYDSSNYEDLIRIFK